MTIAIPFLERVAEMVANISVDNAEAAILSKTTGSLTMASSASRVEPRVIIDESLSNFEGLEAVQKFVFYLFTGYYLCAANMMSTINGVTVSDKLGQLNPNRDLSMLGYSAPTRLDALNGQIMMADNVTCSISTECYKYALPIKRSGQYTFESKRLTDDLMAGNLAIGKIVSVEFTVDGTNYRMPVVIRLIPRFDHGQLCKAILSNEDIQDNSLRGRIDKVNSGEIEFMRDFIFCRDMNEKKRKLAVLDKNGTYKEMQDKQGKNLLTAFLTGKRSYALANSIMIIDSAAMRQAEISLKGRLESAAVRKAIFSNTTLMMLIVVDRAYERIKVASAGVSDVAEYSIKQITVKDNKDVDLKEFIAAFAHNRTPSF
ncbi:MAG: hypothetical protein ACKO0Z_03435 [Betaproteobacteria bacterium]